MLVNSAGLAWRKCLFQRQVHQVVARNSVYIRTVSTAAQCHIICHQNIKTCISGKNILTNNYQGKGNLKSFHTTGSRNGSSSSTNKRQFLLLATYGSFAIGGFLILAIIFRELKKKRMQWKGIVEMNIPAWRRVLLYKYKEVSLPGFVVNKLDEIEKFEARPDDVWVVSFPRSGTTWLQEIVYLINSDMNFVEAGTQHLDDRFPYLEFMYPGIKTIDATPSPRLIKSHLPWSLLPESVKQQNPKIIYIARNPRDVLVSYYYYIRLLHPVTRYDGKFDEFFDLFIQDKVMYTPWSNHVLDFWNNRHEDNILFITYEDLKKDTSGSIDKIAHFLGKRVSEADKEKIIKHCSFERMKLNKMTNHSWFEAMGVSDPEKGEFMRKGCVGDWANHFTKDMGVQMNRMLSRKFHDTDLNFSYQGTHIVAENNSKNSDMKQN